MDGIEQHARSLTPPTDFSRRGFLTTSLIAGFTVAAGPVNAQNVITTDTTGLEAGEVKVPVADGQIPAYRSMPAQGGPFPTIIVVQEIFGVHEHIKDVCRRFAKQGYLAVAPELYTRVADVTKLTTLEAGLAAARAAPDATVLKDLDSTMAWAKGNKGDVAKLGITGFCYGGRVVWLYSAHQPALKAGVAWYGQVARSFHPEGKPAVDLVKDMKAPVLGLYGSADTGIPVAEVDKMKEALKAAGSKSEIHMYDGAPHAFLADYRASYREQPAKDGWQRCIAWFKQHGVA
jgi:carboxymethylenebutenolidase